MVMLFWVLPSLVSFLLTTWACRKEGDTLEDLNNGGYLAAIVACTIFYPIGILVVFFSHVLPALIKERTFKLPKKKN